MGSQLHNIQKQVATGTLAKFQVTKFQYLLAAIAASALIILGALSYQESRTAEARTKVLSDIETPAASIIFTQRETLVYATRLALWSNGGATRRSVQIARNLLAQRLAVIDSSGRTMGSRASKNYWSALNRADSIVAAAPMGILPESEHSKINNELLPVIDQILAQARNLVVSYQRSVDAEMLSIARDTARRDAIKLSLFYLFILIGGLFLIFNARTNFKNYRAVRAAIESEQNHLESTIRELEAAHIRVNQLQNLDEAKSALISNVNHELRTPLTSIMGYIELIQRDETIEKNPQLNRYLEILERNSQILLTLVESILSLSKFDNTSEKPSKEIVSLNQVIDSAIFTLNPAIAKAEIELILRADQEVFVQGEKSQLIQVFINLVANAVKFSPPRSVIEIEILARDTAIVTIRDYGIGIPAQDLPNLFTRFFRASNVPTSQYQGTGLGLAIAQQVLSLHGGAIKVQSELSHGTTFTVEIPLAKGDLHE